MRKTKRHTPKVLARFRREGRGEGTHKNYIPWHRVSRGDPSSLGRSHLLNWRGRLRELLSDGEHGAQLFASMLRNLDDCVEQFPLSADDAPHPLATYGEGDLVNVFPGTERLARDLGIKHPKLSDCDGTVLWTATSDHVLVFRPPGARRSMLALAYKPADWDKKKRTRELLALEREFWLRRKVPWLLITPAQYEASVEICLRRIACWALADEVPHAFRQAAATMARQNPLDTVTHLLKRLQASVGSLELAQRALWQAVWYGELPIDLQRGWRPHLSLRHLSVEAFADQNPIASRRSAWI